ncbi:MAG: hypothetical protein M1812_004678 [Candelaria pacifica]|nr:MAG: hypothetical protein M1812_004678 [Candelaria pacifica]
MYVAQQKQAPPRPPPLSIHQTPYIEHQSSASASSETPGMALPNPSQNQARSSQTIPPVSTQLNGRIYTLEVVQQPIRARMCGFGDKSKSRENNGSPQDRRPITPPPCVRLIVRDADTDKEVDINEIDTSFYILSVDLWSPDGTKEVNLVRHSATSPSISAATATSYPPGPETHPVYQPYYPPIGQYAIAPPPQIPGYNPPAPLGAQPAYYHQQQPGMPLTPAAYYQPGGHATVQEQLLSPTALPSGMFTRNLIGSLSASAFKLTDPDNKIGVWFILQDLSVRTEGTFRLKMNFVNVGDGPALNTKTAPILASVFSDAFQVFSAKKFPGVIESTKLSKCFATQGIKIPIRKDGPKALSNQREYDEDT